MATDLQIPYEKQALTADGPITGLLTVTSTAKLRKGARVLLKSNNVTAIELVIDDIISATVLAVRDPAVCGSARADCSAYTLAQSAAITQNPQVDFYARQWTWF
jgi:hypothetical protein